ncbi:type IV secretory system conjugative DNA transfer family protein [Lacinutrix chionoecetis]
MKIIIDLLLDGLNSIFDGIGNLFDTHQNTGASFGNASKLISKSNKGWSVDGKRFLNLDTSRRNFCVVAGSGKGKTQTHIFPTLLNAQSSMLVNDNSGELTSAVPYLKSIGATSHIMSLNEKTDVYINPLDGCKGDMNAIRKISKSLMGFSNKKADFFSLAAEDCLSLFIQHVVESEPKNYANLGNVYRLILEYQGSPEVVERYMAEKASEAVWVKFKALAGNSERTLKSITATALSSLSWLGDNPVLCDITSITNISFEDFRKSQHVLFIQSPVSDSAFYAPMISLILGSFYRYAFSKLPSENDLDIMMLLDEFSSLIPGLSDYSNIISNSRKFRIPQCLILQDESLLSPYNELKDNILQNCFVKVYYGGQDKKAFELEKLLGTKTIEDSKTGNKKTVPLMSANAIREMDHEILVIPNGQKPLKMKVTPAYKQIRLKKKLALEIEENLEEFVPQYTIQYIDLEAYRINNENSNNSINN